MMENILTALVIAVVSGVLVLLIEYFVLKPDTAKRKKIITAVVLSFFPFVPLLLFQFLSAQLVAATMMERPEGARIDWYANLYAVFALSWGWFWGAKARPWLRARLEGGGHGFNKVQNYVTLRERS